MLLNALSTSLLTTFLFSTTTLAAPTRTHCRCQIVSNTVPTLAIYTPAAAHWTPVNPSPANASPSPNLLVSVPVTLDMCASLGSELERFRHTKPELYELYLHLSSNSSNDKDDAATLAAAAAAAAQNPILTSALLNRNETEQNSVSRSKSRPENSSRIVCFSELPATGKLAAHFQSPFLGLWTLQIIVLVAVLACVAEGLHLCRSWFQYHSDTNTSTSCLSPPSCNNNNNNNNSCSLRLSGTEKRLLAIPMGPQAADQVCSPGAQKKLKAYKTRRYFVTQGKSGRREFIAYEDDSDDEINRPVL